MQNYEDYIKELDLSTCYVSSVLPSSKTLAKYISAYANSNGGNIILGVEKVGNDLETVGLSYDLRFKEILEKALNKLKPQTKIAIQEFNHYGKQLIVIEVKSSTTAVFYNNEKYVVEDNNLTKLKGEVELDKTKVFIVHGHDTLAKVETARFIESLGLKAIILHEQASSGSTIIEKIEEYTNVGFAIVLYTPCDLGKVKGDDDLKARARQNVVFEHGYLMGKIGRKNVCALVKSEVERPNDISGVVYIPMDDHGAWKTGLVKEMMSSGYNIDAYKLFE
ncbi:MAG: DNA-binding protein [Firmicutes bacterium]|nr:DNA-binding protein [Bacillota bacterium]